MCVCAWLFPSFLLPIYFPFGQYYLAALSYSLSPDVSVFGFIYTSVSILSLSPYASLSPLSYPVAVLQIPASLSPARTRRTQYATFLHGELPLTVASVLATPSPPPPPSSLTAPCIIYADPCLAIGVSRPSRTEAMAGVILVS